MSPRDADALLIEPWAETGLRKLPEDMGVSRDVGLDIRFALPTGQTFMRRTRPAAAPRNHLHVGGGGPPWPA